MNTDSLPVEFARSPRMKLLIIDDEPANVALAEEMLAESGYTRVQSITDSRKPSSR